MTVRPAAAPRRTSLGVPRHSYKPFTLTLDLERRRPRFVLSIREAPQNGSKPATVRLASLTGERAGLLLPTVLDLLHKSGFPLRRLEARCGGRIRLPEGLGARVALLIWASAPLQKQSRAALVRAGVLAMADEEVYYWYAKAEGGPAESARRRRENTLKSLRVLLAGD